MTNPPLRIGIVAGEASGDILGAGLMAALAELAQGQQRSIGFEGVGGPRMLELGFNSLYPMDRLSVMGITEPLNRLPELLSMRSALKKHFAAHCDVFIGIDSPDFTLNIEADLRARGVKTVHYVSPSVWAWRRGRIKTISRAVDLMLTLLPFEADFYIDHKVPVKFVGHPLADQISFDDQRDRARSALSIDPSRRVLAVLPGSRGGEVTHLAPAFLDTIDWLRQEFPDLDCIIPAVNSERRAQLEALAAEASAPDIEAFVADGRRMLEQLRRDGVLLGTQPDPETR